MSARGAFAPNAQKTTISAKNLMIKKGVQFKLPRGASDSLALALASIVIQERDTERIKRRTEKRGDCETEETGKIAAFRLVLDWGRWSRREVVRISLRKEARGGPGGKEGFPDATPRGPLLSSSRASMVKKP